MTLVVSSTVHLQRGDQVVLELPIQEITYEWRTDTLTFTDNEIPPNDPITYEVDVPATGDFVAVTQVISPPETGHYGIYLLNPSESMHLYCGPDDEDPRHLLVPALGALSMRVVYNDTDLLATGEYSIDGEVVWTPIGTLDEETNTFTPSTVPFVARPTKVGILWESYGA